MRFAAAVAAAGLAAGVAAHGNGTEPVWVTQVVTAFTTFCPEATQLTHNGVTYTVSEATTLTITHCPGGCTISAPISSSSATEVPSAAVPSVTAPSVTAPWTTSVATSVPSVPAPYPTETSAVATPVAPSAYTPSGAPYPSTNGTVPVSYAPSGTGAPGSSTSAPVFNGAATYGSAFGAGLLAVAGAVAFL